MPLHERGASEMFPQLGTSAYGEGYDSSAATAKSTTLTRTDGEVPNSEHSRPPALLCCQGECSKFISELLTDKSIVLRKRKKAQELHQTQLPLPLINIGREEVRDTYVPRFTPDNEPPTAPRWIPYLAHTNAVKRTPYTESPIYQLIRIT